MLYTYATGSNRGQIRRLTGAILDKCPPEPITGEIPTHSDDLFSQSLRRWSKPAAHLVIGGHMYDDYNED